MNLEKVTITGADDSTSVKALVDLSHEFPFVEWGILVSWSSEGQYRFPSRKWIDQLVGTSDGLGLNLQLSTHVCGRWVRELLTGCLYWEELPSVIDVCQRVQINTHGIPHVSTIKLISALRARYWKQYIFQLDGINDHLPCAAKAFGLNIAGLFDTSAGAGVLPEEGWTKPYRFPCGYAGGLSPDNVVEQIENIEKVCDKPYWIDMERRVRTDDDSALDMKKVRAVLEKCKPLVKL